MKPVRNLALAAVAVLAVYFVIRGRTPSPFSGVHPTPTPAAEVKPLYEPNDVTEMAWSFHDTKLSFKKPGNDWVSGAGRPLGPDASWAVVRRVAVLSRSQLIVYQIPAPQGRFSVKVKKDRWNGQYDSDGYEWTSGPAAGKGFAFSADHDLQNLFNEGLYAFQPHRVKLCDPRTVRSVEVDSEWSLFLQSSKWMTKKGKDVQPARATVTGPFLERLCEFKADLFKADPIQPPKNARVVLKISGPRGNVTVFRAGNFYFSGRDPSFSSSDMDSIVATDLDDLKDPSLEEAKVALDPSKTTRERIAAIRKIKEMRSVDGIPALKFLIFENTDLDVYRYEAVDALAAIGTKECFKIIADRLAQVGRSGFELRLARALSAAMGLAFKSDEKTPEDIRRPEVNALLEAYKKNPPGR